jgi:hypothetical protein
MPYEAIGGTGYDPADEDDLVLPLLDARPTNCGGEAAQSASLVSS